MRCEIRGDEYFRPQFFGTQHGFRVHHIVPVPDQRLWIGRLYYGILWDRSRKGDNEQWRMNMFYSSAIIVVYTPLMLVSADLVSPAASFINGRSVRRFSTVAPAWLSYERSRKPIFPLEVSSLSKDSNESDSAGSSGQDLSDEEVLLACRAYLLRHKKIGWAQQERRKNTRDASLALTEGETGAVGYFWENPEELLYLKSTGGSGLGTTRQNEQNEVVTISKNDAESGDNTDLNYFKWFPDRPTEEHENRSKAQREKWKDPEWKALWYERRWGKRGEKKIAAKEKKQRRLESMIESIPVHVLNSPAFAEMTNTEVDSAIASYLSARRRRSTSRKTSEIEQKDLLRPRESSAKGADSEEEKLVKLQQQRSQRAKKAYQTRLANQETKNEESEGMKRSGSIKLVMPSSLPYVFAAREALERIELALDSGTDIDENDIDLILVPGRMSGRKDLLLRIMRERFDLRGKCVPDDAGRLLFATTCSLKKLGVFVKKKVMEREQDFE